MDTQKLASIIRSLDTIPLSNVGSKNIINTDNCQSNLGNKSFNFKTNKFTNNAHTGSSRVIKPLSTNRTIRYFQNISQYRIRSNNKTEEKKAVKEEATANNSTFNPYSTSQLISFIQTYQTPYWPISHTSNLKTLTPLYLSLNGWVCSSHTKEEISCITCLNRIMIIIPETKETEITEEDIEDQKIIIAALEEKYLGLLKESHDLYCPWRSLIGKDDKRKKLVYDVLVDRFDENLQNFKNLYSYDLNFLRNADDETIYNKLSFDKETDYDLSHLEKWMNFQTDEPFNNKVHKSAALLALSNWKLSSAFSSDEYHKGQPIIGSCDACNRRFLISDPVNIIEEHQNWCRYNRKGVETLLQMFKILNLQNQSDIRTEEIENQTNVSTNLQADYEDLKSHLYEIEDRTSERLDKLRQVYFE